MAETELPADPARRAERLVNAIRAMVAVAWGLVNLLFEVPAEAWLPVGVLALSALFSAGFSSALVRRPAALPGWLPYATMGADVAAVVLSALTDHTLSPLMPGALGLIILTTAFRVSLGLTAAASAVTLVVWLGFGGVAGAIRGAPSVVSNLVGLGVVGVTALFLVQEVRDRIVAAAAAESRRARVWDSLALHLNAEQAARLEAEGPAAVAAGRREVTTVVARLGGLVALSRGNPDMALRAMGEYLDACARVAGQADAAVDRYFGAELRAVLNAPLSQPEHARRGLILARDLHLAVALLNQDRASRGAPSLYLTVVVHSSEAWVGRHPPVEAERREAEGSEPRTLRIGAERRPRYVVASEEAPLISALLDLAAPGETLATETTVARAGLPEPLEPLEVPGRPGVVQAARIRTLSSLLPASTRLYTDETSEV